MKYSTVAPGFYPGFKNADSKINRIFGVLFSGNNHFKGIIRLHPLKHSKWLGLNI
jgi:hypothetical protein